ncbi:MAG TPA: type II secretion system protein [Candidatus Angelobacter sp.]
MNEKVFKPQGTNTALKTRAAGFTLIELLVAVAVFMIVGGAAVAVVRNHMPLFSQQQKQAALNVSLRNAIAQMQIDVVNAGTGYYPADDIPAWPIGVTIANRNGGGCYDAVAKTYGANCFDTLNVIAFDLNAPAAHPAGPSAGACADTYIAGGTATTTINLLPADAGVTLNALANSLSAGDELLLVTNGGNPTKLTTVSLTDNASVSGGVVQVPIATTTNQGVHVGDPSGIADAAVQANGVLATQFCGGVVSDWVLKLAPITYRVDTTDPTNPKLVRQAKGGPADVVAEQILGFKVGASLRNGPGSEVNGYNYNSGDPLLTGDVHAYSGNWSAITSIRVSVIGRAAATGDVNSNYQNTFDGGNYKVEGVSVVINPRNLTMND